MEQLDSFFQPVADVIALPVDQTKFLVCTFLSYFLSLYFRTLSDVKQRYIVGLVFGVIFGLVLFGSGLVHSLISSSIVYVLVKFGKGPQIPKIVFVFSMGYLLLGHLYRQYYDYMGWKLDFTAPQMMIALKTISFAYDVNDAQRVKKAKEDNTTIDQKNLRCIFEFPSPLEYFSYIYFYGGFFFCPPFFFYEYKTLLRRSTFAENKFIFPFPSI
eukprot:TRINITY_DN177_c0_g1_i3.p1 TRINITY_DN177_c0_g1~~TRINITY_DN177_c0_g1_i3.p1  ORF type:complete len:214 (+),score=11.43 TRINITY_DN177_c0_g1_i3:53-694(+)